MEKCPNCGLDALICGELVSTGGIVFVPYEQQGTEKQCSYISALACRKCGTVFGFKLLDKPAKITDR